MKNSIEEDIKILERIDVKYFMSAKIEQSDYMIDKADEVNNAIEHILSDYKRVLKENEELNLKYYMLYTGKIENLKAQEVKIKSQVIPIQKVKDKIEEYKKNLYTVEHYETVGAINVLQELLEGRK